MEWIKTILNAVRAAVDGVSAKVDRLNAWAKTFAWVPAMSVTEDVILQNAKWEFESDGIVFSSTVPTVGVTYDVTINGKTYKATAWQMDNDGQKMTLIGEYMLTTKKDLPFLFGWVNGQAMFLYDGMKTGDTFVVSIAGRSVKAEKLPDVFIPDQILDATKDTARKTDPVFTGTFSQNRKAGSTIGDYSHAEGYETEAWNKYSHAEGYQTRTNGNAAHAEGEGSIASSSNAHAEGYKTSAGMEAAHAEGSETTAFGRDAHAEGYKTAASGDYSHAEGDSTTASTYASHAEGTTTTASGGSSHAEGLKTKASGKDSHAEGAMTTASGNDSHAEGRGTTASGSESHAEGHYTTASGDTSHVQGKFNIEDKSGKYAHIVGNGVLGKPSNAHTLDWNGVPWFQGRPQFGGTAQDNGSQSVVANGDTKITLKSSVAGSSKTFDLSVDDNGVLPESLYAPAMPVILTQAEYDALAAAGTVDESKVYFIKEEVAAP